MDNVITDRINKNFEFTIWQQEGRKTFEVALWKGEEAVAVCLWAGLAKGITCDEYLQYCSDFDRVIKLNKLARKWVAQQEKKEEVRVLTKLGYM
jgi:hypothetical protein